MSFSINSNPLLMELRKKQHDIFIEGRYIREFVPGGDNPQIDVPTFGKNHVVMGSEWQSKDGQRVWYVVNMDTQAHEVILPSGKSLIREKNKSLIKNTI